VTSGGRAEDALAARPAPSALATDEYRIEGREKVLGTARFAADYRRPGMLWAAYVRSPLAHARIRTVDVTAARAEPGVQYVLCGADVRPARIGRTLQDWPVLAWDRVRFVGDRVVAIAAETPEAAERAAALVQVDYEELPAVFDPRAALEPGAPILHPDADDYVYLGGERPPRRHSNLQGEHCISTGGADIETVMATAARVFEHEFTTPRQHQGYIEPHACLVWLGEGTVHVVSTNKGPFMLRMQMAASLGIEESAIEVESPFIGGDFGGKGLSLDEQTCFFLARATGRPVMAVMSYLDEMQAAAPRHRTWLRLRTGVDRDGRFLAHEMTALVDGGAYAAGKPGRVLAPLGTLETMAPYRVPHARLQLTAVYTNSVPGGNMRAPGEYQAIFAGESHVDMIAASLGIDPLELRRRNAIRDGETSPTGTVAHQPRVVEVVNALDEIAERRERRSGTGHGIGFAIGIRGPASGRSTVAIRLQQGGAIEVLTGVPDQGGGTHTAIRRVAGAALSVDPSRIAVRLGSTASGLVDTGVSGSRITYHTSRAVEIAADRLREALVQVAAERLTVARAAVELADDAFVVRDGAGHERRHAFELVVGIELGPFVATFDDETNDRSASMDSVAGYAVEVDVDPETGQVTIADATLVADVGTIINPLAHQGQLTGGFVGGLGGALMEEVVVIDGRVATVGLHDYKLPTSADVPPFRTVPLPSPPGPGAFGAKMAGEMSNGAVAPAIANAIADAVGIRATSLPLSAERVHDLLRDRNR
jgi:CO/xanthine dehydrogenase Mo-binding subunit